MAPGVSQLGGAVAVVMAILVGGNALLAQHRHGASHRAQAEAVPEATQDTYGEVRDAAGELADRASRLRQKIEAIEGTTPPTTPPVRPEPEVARDRFIAAPAPASCPTRATPGYVRGGYRPPECAAKRQAP
jgi:hypothetical protein